MANCASTNGVGLDVRVPAGPSCGCRIDPVVINHPPLAPPCGSSDVATTTPEPSSPLTRRRRHNPARCREIAARLQHRGEVVGQITEVADGEIDGPRVVDTSLFARSPNRVR